MFTMSCAILAHRAYSLNDLAIIIIDIIDSIVRVYTIMCSFVEILSKKIASMSVEQ